MAKLGRKKVEEPSTPEQGEARDHGRQRTLYRAGNSWVVAVPLWARRLVDRVEGGSVYWHEHRAGEVVLSAEPKRGGGRLGGASAERQIGRLTRENLRLRRRLRARPLAALNEQIGPVMMQAIKVGLPITATIEETRDLVREVLSRIPWRGPRRPRRVEKVPAPVLEASPAPEENQEGGAAPLASAEAAPDLIQGSQVPAPAEE